MKARTFVLGALSALLAAPGAAAASRAPTIEVLSSRADLVSGGDALVAVDLPRGVKASRARVMVGRRDVTKAFSIRPDGRWVGLVDHLRLGRSAVAVKLPRRRGARLVVTNHPNGGPVFAGPQPQPWTCQKGAVDAQCNQPPTYEYFYKSTDPQQKYLQPYDLASPPADVATTKTETGVEMPFVVRVETGYQDRDQYKIATLFQVGKPWTWSSPQPQSNRKLVITHGGGCGVSYAAGGAPSVTSYIPGVASYTGDVPLPEQGGVDVAIASLGRGFVVMSTALNNNGHNCNLVTQAESMLMAKERVIETYGPLRWTIGTGCSGGSLTQQWVANAYPGLYQGILPTCSFPDTWTSATQVLDYHLLRGYFEDPSKWGPGVAWSPTQWAAVEGHGLPVNAIVSDIGFFYAVVSTYPCWGSWDAARYHPETNPGGIRCSAADLAINVFGPRPASVWAAAEKKIGRGFAGVPVDNVGVQYGLAALQRLEITPSQFVDLNARVGGVDIDTKPSPQRITADRPALANAYRSGSINVTNNLDRTPIIDCRGPDPGAAHDSYRAYAVRARLDREHGSHDNHVIWEGPVAIVGDNTCGWLSLLAMDRWIAAIAKDTGDKSLARKVADNKPADIADACWDGVGNKVSDGLCPPGIDPVYGTPRTVAGDAITTDTNKCRLKPLARADYAIPFTDAEWQQLQQAFPAGVCDYSKPGVDKQPTIPWLTYQEPDGKVIHGGKPMAAPPRSAACGWTRATRRRPARCVR